MDEDAVAAVRDRFLPRKGNLRIVWLAGLESKVTRRECEKICLSEICSELVSVQLSLSLYSVFLVGLSRLYQRQVYYVYGDTSKLVTRIKQASAIIDAMTRIQSKVTMPEASGQIVPLSDCDLSLIKCQQYLSESEFFTIEPDNGVIDLQEFTKHTIASPLEITLPNESNMSSFAYSITESPCDFNFCGEPLLSCHDSPVVDPMLLDTPTTDPQQFPSLGRISLGKFVSPIAESVEDPVMPPTISRYARDKLTSKRRLVFDKKTQLSEESIMNNAASWRDTLRHNKLFSKQSSSQLLCSPVGCYDVYAKPEFLNLWKLNAVIESDANSSDTSDEQKSDLETMQFSRQSMQVSGLEDFRVEGSTINNSEMSNERSSFDSEASSHFVTQDTQSRMRTSGVGAPIVDNIGYLPPIPDIQEEDSGCQLPQDDYYSNHDVMDQMNASKSVNFFNYLVVPKLQQGEIATFRSILPAKCSRQTASLAFMHILELIQQGVVRPKQQVPYGNIELIRGQFF